MEFKDKGLNIVGINRGDSRETVIQYVRRNQFTFQIAMGGSAEVYIGTKYGVWVYPTNYLLDSNGKVIWRNSGFDETGIRAALQQLGVK
jgi:hypothetical protein